MNKQLLLAATAVLAFTAPTLAQTSSGTKPPAAVQRQAQLSQGDRTFIEQALIRNMLAIRLSELAQQHARNAEIKSFAAQLVRDYRNADQELQGTAQRLGGKVPAELDARRREILRRLEVERGITFDRDFIQAERDAHHEAITDYSAYMKLQGNPDLKAWADKRLAVLQERQRQLQQMNALAQGETDSTTGRSAAEPPKTPMKQKEPAKQP